MTGATLNTTKAAPGVVSWKIKGNYLPMLEFIPKAPVNGKPGTPAQPGQKPAVSAAANAANTRTCRDAALADRSALDGPVTKYRDRVDARAMIHPEDPRAVYELLAERELLPVPRTAGGLAETHSVRVRSLIKGADDPEML